MRKINLKNYNVKVPVGPDETKDIEYKVKQSITAVLFHKDQKLGGRELIKQNKLADKIEKAKDEILLEEAEYAKLKKAFETVKGFQKADVELVNRVLEAPTVDVKEANENV